MAGNTSGVLAEPHVLLYRKYCSRSTVGQVGMSLGRFRVSDIQYDKYASYSAEE